MRRPLDVPRLRTALLNPARPWSGVDAFADVDSTNAEALRRPEPWRVVVTDHQSAGRGRLARQWSAPPCASIAVTCVLPVGAPGPDWGWLPLLTGLAMRGALEQGGGVRVGLKWPNDLLAAPVNRRGDHSAEDPEDDAGEEPRKICGILAQTLPAGAAENVAVVGAGVNIDQHRAELPIDTATSLRCCGVPDVSREAIIISYLDGLLERYAAWQAGGAALDGLRSAYRSACLTIGQVVDVHRPGGTSVRGRASGVDDQGRLLLTGPWGTAAHAAGDVVHVRPADRSPTDRA